MRTAQLTTNQAGRKTGARKAASSATTTAKPHRAPCVVPSVQSPPTKNSSPYATNLLLAQANLLAHWTCTLTLEAMTPYQQPTAPEAISPKLQLSAWRIVKVPLRPQTAPQAPSQSTTYKNAPSKHKTLQMHHYGSPLATSHQPPPTRPQPPTPSPQQQPDNKS